MRPDVALSTYTTGMENDDDDDDYYIQILNLWGARQFAIYV